MSTGLTGRTIVLGVTGSIAAYKAVVLLRLLLKDGARVEVVLSRSAEQFVGRATFAGLLGKPALSDMFDPHSGGELHVELGNVAELILIVPATADVLSRLAHGRADDLLTATALCSRAPLLIAPAMHPSMWDHPTTRRNVAQLLQDGQAALVGPVTGEVASGERGMGRMADPEEIHRAVSMRLAPQDLAGRHVVVTAGPTLEDLDPVRYLGNRSSGKMGFAIAERARARGARVTLITGPVGLPTPRGVERVDVRSALSMRDAVWNSLGADLGAADALIMAAAVGDFRPRETSATKLKREHAEVSLELLQNPDILAEIGRARSGATPTLIGFAVEADAPERVLSYARTKLIQKRVDLVVANHASDSFGRDDNRATLVGPSEAKSLPVLPKTELADEILNWLSQHWPKND
jgi:phosphopantothenoylcysteine decarboxylase / phosphopantothenate---cysteine ligase